MTKAVLAGLAALLLTLSQTASAEGGFVVPLVKPGNYGLVGADGGTVNALLAASLSDSGSQPSLASRSYSSHSSPSHSYSSGSHSSSGSRSYSSGSRSYSSGSRGSSPVTGSRTRSFSNGSRVTTSHRANGGSTTRTVNRNGTSATRTVRINPTTGKPAVTVRKRDSRGNVSTFHSNGAKSWVGKDGSRKYTSPNGRRTTSDRVSYKDGTRTVTRTVRINNRVVNRSYSYNRYSYGGRSYYHYVPVWNPFFFNPFFFAWSNPYYYDWGWGYGNPWYAYYQGYFTPYPYYANPWEFVTDAYIATTLSDRYDDTATDDSQQPQSQLTPLTQDEKDQIAQQVKEEMENYKNQQPLTLDSTLNTQRIFSVDADFDSADIQSGDPITLAAGDLIRLAAVPDPGAESAVMEVVSSASAPVGTQFNVSLEKLQQMNDKFVQDTEAAMEQLRQAKESGNLKP